MAEVIDSGKFIDAESMSADITSDTLVKEDTEKVSFQFHADSATHVGTLTIQGSIDKTNWNAIPFYDSTGALVTSVSAASGSPFDESFDIQTNLPYLRAVYTRGSGTGSLDGSWYKMLGRGVG